LRRPRAGEKINPLGTSNFAQGRLRWHNFRDTLVMSFLVILFPVICSLLCALVCADHQASDVVESARVRDVELP